MAERANLFGGNLRRVRVTGDMTAVMGRTAVAALPAPPVSSA
jgi:hypothetical protein